MRCSAFAIALAFTVGAAADENPSRYGISIYNGASSNADALFEAVDADAGTAPGGYAVVRDRRQFDLKAGANTLQVRDVSRWLDPGALSVRLLGDGNGAEILSQRFENDPLSFDVLTQKHLGHIVEIASGDGAAGANTVSGTLLSSAGGLTVQTADGRVITVTEFSRVTFPDLPKGLSATPALRWDMTAKNAGAQVFEIVYPTQGLGWRAEYNAWIAPGGDCKVDFSAWAQIANRSGNDFHNAHIKLIAGEPHRVTQASQPRPMLMAKAAPGHALAANDSGMAGDYHEYTLDAAVDLGSGSLVRVALYPSQPLPCERQYLFESTRLHVNPGMAPMTDRGYGSDDEHQPVLATLGLHVDRPLPAGRIRVIEDASDGTPEFVGEDHIRHTPRGEPITIDLGDAFDLRGERSQTDYQIDKERRSMNESFAIRLVNRSAHAQTVTVREHLYRWTQWNIVQSSTKYEKRNADTVDFKLEAPANGEAKLTYTVQYQWTESYK
ncbi:MAG: DUF4139 domain-containing protein [Rudaea sp.]|nr:DUF4139 domain-containing protein [Rudaea sp.]